MKFWVRSWLVICFALAGLASPAQAASGEKVEAEDGAKDPANLLERFDRDGDVLPST